MEDQLKTEPELHQKLFQHQKKTHLIHLKLELEFLNGSNKTMMQKLLETKMN